jgi:hypothetical protein
MVCTQASRVRKLIGCILGMFERLRVILLGEDGKMTPGRALYIGALSKTLATVVSLMEPCDCC